MTATNPPELTWAFYGLAAFAVLVLALLGIVALKNRSVPQGEVFKASRWTRGNRIFPTQVSITPTSVLQRKPQWLGRREESIHIGHVASVKIDTGMLFSNVIIETSGGSEPIVCHGHSKRDAERMKMLIGQHQAAPTRVAAGTAGIVPDGAVEGRVCPFCAETVKSAATVCRYCGRELAKTA